LLASTPPAFAAHPMLTEDTGTQGAGKFELELGFAQARDGGTRALEFGPQLSYGALDNLDLIARPTWLYVRGGATDGTTQGFGDTGLDFKWRFPAQGSLTFGVRAGVDLPTGNADQGLGSGKASPHAILISTYMAGAWMLAANVDYVYDPLVGDRRNLWGASAAAAYSMNAVWRFTAEVGTAMNPDAAQASWLTVARLGAIATVVKGLDVDAGYQVRLTRSAPVEIILAGVTVRW
jgi:hypothetical protein